MATRRSVLTHTLTRGLLQGLTLNRYHYMLDDYGFEIYEENAYPIAYLLTFRTFGTWLHGDARGSVRRNGNSRYGGPKVMPSVPLKDAMNDLRHEALVILDASQRACVEAAIKEVCEFRKYDLRALNVHTNHAHAVVSACLKPEKIVNDFKVVRDATLAIRG